MPLEDGVVTSVVRDPNLTIPLVNTSPMMRALYVQFQTMFDVSDTLIAQQAFTAQTLDRLNLVNTAMAEIPPGAFAPADVSLAYQAYLDLLSVGMEDSTLGDKNYAAFYSEQGQMYLVEFPPPQQNISELSELNLDPGTLALVSVNGGPQTMYYAPLQTPSDTTIPAPVNLGTPRPFLADKAPDGKAWVNVVQGPAPEHSTVNYYPVIPEGTPVGSYLKMIADDGSTHYFRVGANDLAQEINQNGNFMLFDKDYTAEEVKEMRKTLSDFQSQLTEQSTIQNNYMLQLVAQLVMFANATSNSLYRIQRSAKLIVEQGIGA